MKRFSMIALALATAIALTSAVLAGCSTTPSTESTPPQINSINPDFGQIGTGVTLRGLYFGTTQGTGQVTFHGVVAPVGNWSDWVIVVKVPEGAETGDVLVNTADGTSNAVTFTISTTSPSPTTEPQDTTTGTSSTTPGK